MAYKKTFIVSTEDVNSYGFWVLTSGIDLTAANKNCPAYFNHQTWDIPLGHWENIRVDGTQLMADLIIEGASDEEKEYIRKIENGDIKGASIGADPLEWDSNPLLLKPGQTMPLLAKSSLFEISVAPLPGNTSALALKHKGNLITLSADNLNIIPQLKQDTNMKSIALALGLTETATEQQMHDAVKVLLSRAANADAMQKIIEEKFADKLPEGQKAFFVTLAKTNVAHAMEYLSLNVLDSTTVEATTHNPAAPVTLVKDKKVSEMIRPGAQTQQAAADGKDTYDYLQKHNAVELSRLHREEPAKYQQLAKDFQNGIRYKG